MRQPGDRVRRRRAVARHRQQLLCRPPYSSVGPTPSAECASKSEAGHPAEGHPAIAAAAEPVPPRRRQRNAQIVPSGSTPDRPGARPDRPRGTKVRAPSSLIRLDQRSSRALRPRPAVAGGRQTRAVLFGAVQHLRRLPGDAAVFAAGDTPWRPLPAPPPARGARPRAPAVNDGQPGIHQARRSSARRPRWWRPTRSAERVAGGWGSRQSHARVEDARLVDGQPRPGPWEQGAGPWGRSPAWPPPDGSRRRRCGRPGRRGRCPGSPASSLLAAPSTTW